VAIVHIPAALRGTCGGRSEIKLEGDTIGALLRNLDGQCPGIYARLVSEGRLRPELAFAVGGEILPLALHDTVGPDAEVTIVPALGGG